MNKLISTTLVVFLFLSLIFSLQAQIIGGRANGQQTPKEVGATGLSKGAVSGDVNLFNGTYGSSYSLGTVSSPGGVSFSLGLSYSSSFASGDNLPNTSGIPYGEGWNLDIPMISVSMEDYNQYTLKEIANKRYRGPSGDSREEITFTDPGREGELMWFAPTLSIPGVASGRLVYKYTQRYRGEYVPVFVLHQFDQYIEAKFDGFQWIVTTDDGTEYRMAPTLVNQRTPQNRRTYETDAQILNFLKPKEEKTKWHVYKISHPNKTGTVNFRYNVFGAFNLAAEHHQRWLMSFFSNNSNNVPGAKKTYYQDIFLKEIYSESEKLVLKHRSLFDHNISGAYEVDDPSITRLDSLYTSKEVLGWGSNNNTLFNKPNEEWKRYVHLKSNAVQNVLGCSFSDPACSGSTYDISKTNPYEGNLGTFGGTVFNHLVMEKNDDQSSAIGFNHGFLESPSFDNNLPSGDWYEIKTNISGTKGQPDDTKHRFRSRWCA